MKWDREVGVGLFLAFFQANFSSTFLYTGCSNSILHKHYLDNDNEYFPWNELTLKLIIIQHLRNVLWKYFAGTPCTTNMKVTCHLNYNFSFFCFQLKMRTVNFLLIKNLCIVDLVGAVLVLPVPLIATAKGIYTLL